MKCAALVDSWESARAELVMFAEATETTQAPARVQMRLLQELRAQKRPHELYRRTGMIASWGLAAAALIVVGITWMNWRKGAEHPLVVKNSRALTASKSTSAEQAALVTDEDSGSFTPLPGALPIANEDDSIYQVRMQRASLSALGLPVSGESAADWVNVDLLVSDDGTPQGVRLHQDASDSGTL
ncbi:MAG TPA: hypothetical protein VKD70_04990 [Candidatus Acidoferrum sp.]|nr:hypothetical protein [Candidatus Acidoferrum sp.]